MVKYAEFVSQRSIPQLYDYKNGGEMKKLLFFKKSKYLNTDNLAGFCLKKKNIICINVELLWKHSENENEFIKLFSEYFTHEWLHLYLNKFKSTNLGEEKVIRSLLNQSFSKHEIQYYKKAYKE